MLTESWANPIKYPEFTTHNNYLECVTNLSDKLQIKILTDFSKNISESKEVAKKLHLINLLIENLESERNIVSDLPEYSVACVAWIPVKAYYVIFNLLIILEYLITCDEKMLQNAHKKTAKLMKQYLQDGSLKFNILLFNKIFTSAEISGWKIPKSENIKTSNADLEIRKKQVIKKLFDYCRDDYKREKRLNRFTKDATLDFNKNATISLFEFFYWYRIKSNYHDLNFINSGVPVNDFVTFFHNYCTLTANFVKAFKKAINELSLIRLNKILF